MKETTLKTVREATLKAYGDCNDFYNGRERNLNYRAPFPVPADEAEKIMTEALGLESPEKQGYNEFSPALLRVFPKETPVVLAREGSVCVYVETDMDVQRLQTLLRADEVDAREEFWRIWWD